MDDKLVDRLCLTALYSNLWEWPLSFQQKWVKLSSSKLLFKSFGRVCNIIYIHCAFLKTVFSTIFWMFDSGSKCYWPSFPPTWFLVNRKRLNQIISTWFIFTITDSWFPVKQWNQDLKLMFRKEIKSVTEKINHVEMIWFNFFLSTRNHVVGKLGPSNKRCFRGKMLVWIDVLKVKGNVYVFCQKRFAKKNLYFPGITRQNFPRNVYHHTFSQTNIADFFGKHQQRLLWLWAIFTVN